MTRYDVNLSALSLQHTFLHVKTRLETALTHIAEVEKLSDVPSLISEKYRFKIQGDQRSLYFDLLDRIGAVTSP